MRLNIITITFLLFASCTGEIRKSDFAKPSYVYLGDNSICYLPMDSAKRVVFFTDYQNASDASILLSKLKERYVNAKIFDFNQLKEVKLSQPLADSLDIFVVPNPKVNPIDLIGLLKNLSGLHYFLVVNNPNANLLFRKLAYQSSNDSTAENFKNVGVGGITMVSGFDLVGLPLVLVQSDTESRIPKMLSVAMQNPLDYIISFDDSAFLTIQRNVINVYGKGQMFMIKHPEATTRVDNGLFGGENLQVSVFLPGDSVIIK